MRGSVDLAAQRVYFAELGDLILQRDHKQVHDDEIGHQTPGHAAERCP